MYQRFLLICMILLGSLGALLALGVSSLRAHEQGLRAERQSQFIAVAEQTRSDVKRKFDEFIRTEQTRPYFDYQSFYVPESANQVSALVKSPLADSLDHGLAYGHFQIDDLGRLTLPYQTAHPGTPSASNRVSRYILNLQNHLAPLLADRDMPWARRIDKPALLTAKPSVSRPAANIPRQADLESQQNPVSPTAAAQKKPAQVIKYKIEVFDSPQMQSYQYTQSRRAVEEYIRRTSQNIQMTMNTQTASAFEPNSPTATPTTSQMFYEKILAGWQAPYFYRSAPSGDESVAIRIDPFTPFITAYPVRSQDIFPGQVFLLRSVQIEDRCFLQGFLLNQSELLNQLKDSAMRFLRRGMGFDLTQGTMPDAAYTAILDFGFGTLSLHLLEGDPEWIDRRVATLQSWFWAIALVALLAMTLAMSGLWKSMNQQVMLSRKKDDFISAVSHELRTPLTSIRMYTEMLEKGWVCSEEKRGQYYTGMRQETERLSRLIENVLDFSRIQRGKKEYRFASGDLNACLGETVRMMDPCALRENFRIQSDFASLEPFIFDRDAVMQIAVNLIDNAIKYANPCGDKTIIVRTRQQRDYVVLEVEDHGPGISRKERTRIFEAFYRSQDESTRQTTGTGLGLALVRRFAEAHRGFVDVLDAHPAGAIFRVGLSRHLNGS